MGMKGNCLAVALLFLGLIVGVGVGYFMSSSVPQSPEPKEVNELTPYLFEYHPTMNIGVDTPVFITYIDGVQYLVYYEIVGKGHDGASIWWRYVEA